MAIYDAVPALMMGPNDALRLLRNHFPELTSLFSDPDKLDSAVPEPYYSYSRLADEVRNRREDRNLVESFCSFINELASSREFWIDEALNDMLEGFVHEDSFVSLLRPHLNVQAEARLRAMGG
jgi:hypothetical protein